MRAFQTAILWQEQICHPNTDAISAKINALGLIPRCNLSQKHDMTEETAQLRPTTAGRVDQGSHSAPPESDSHQSQRAKRDHATTGKQYFHVVIFAMLLLVVYFYARPPQLLWKNNVQTKFCHPWLNSNVYFESGPLHLSCALFWTLSESVRTSSICLTNKYAHSFIISASTGISLILIESIYGNDVTLYDPGFTLFSVQSRDIKHFTMILIEHAPYLKHRV